MTNTEEKKYVDFYFVACLDEFLGNKNSIWETDLNGTEVLKLAEYLDIAIDKKYISDTYWNEELHTINIFHSSTNEMEFLYFDLRRMITDQNDMFFFGVRCEKQKKREVMDRLIHIYDLLKTTGSFSYEKWGWKLLNFRNEYFIRKNDYKRLDKIVHHK